MLDRPIEVERFSGQSTYRRDFAVDVRDQRLADEEMQILMQEIVHDPTLHIGVAAGDERRLHSHGWDCFEAESNKLIFYVAAGKIAAAIHGMELLLRADIDNELAAFVDHLAA
ncbi:MAG TPA: hypothetical protein VMT22_19520, partial [Terriglobales bacterium]|nr:hypothetical protein [Terriglobales bacterium]